MPPAITPTTGQLGLGLKMATETPTGVTFTVTYTEPILNVAGGPSNLLSTKLYSKLDAGVESSVVVPASALVGGGVITRTVTVPILPGQVGTLNVQCTATNATGESARSAVVSKLWDRTS